MKPPTIPGIGVRRDGAPNGPRPEAVGLSAEEKARIRKKAREQEAQRAERVEEVIARLPKYEAIGLKELMVPYRMIPLGQLEPAADGTPRYQGLKVMGISARGIGYLIERFPALQHLMGGRASREDEAFMAALRKLAPDAIAAIIATACGFHGDPEAEETAASMPVDKQMEIIEATAKLTFTQGFGPFVSRLAAMSNAISSHGRLPATPSPMPPSPSGEPPGPNGAASST